MALTKDGEKISNCVSLATYIKGRGPRDGNAYLQTDVYQTASVKSEEEISQQRPEEKWGSRAVGSLQAGEAGCDHQGEPDSEGRNTSGTPTRPVPWQP